MIHPARTLASLNAVLLALLFLAFCGRAFAAGPQVQHVNMVQGARTGISITQPFGPEIAAGWLPIIIQVENKASVARTWKFDFSLELNRASADVGTWTVAAQPGETRSVSILLPVPWFTACANTGQTMVTVSGPEVGQSRIWLNRVYHGAPQTTPMMGMTPALATDNITRLESAVQGDADPTMPPPAPSRRVSRRVAEMQSAVVEPTTLPADWRAFSMLDNFWMSRADWMGLPQAHRLALLEWVFQGGRLFVAGSGENLNGLPVCELEREVGRTAWRYRDHGLGRITRLPLEGQTLDAASGQADGAPELRLPIDDVAQTIRDTAPLPSLASVTIDTTKTGAEMALGEIAVGGILLGLLVAVVAALLGPVNLWLFAPARRRARLFITVPLIAMGGALALLVLVFLQDGAGGHGTRTSLVLLMPDRPEALVVQDQSARTGFLFRRAFAIPEDVALMGLSPDAPTTMWRTGNFRQPESGLDRVGDQGSGHWFDSRSIETQYLRRFVPTRAALTLEPAPDAEGVPTLLSTCPATLLDVIVIDADGRPWEATEVPPGRRVPLRSARGARLDDRTPRRNLPPLVADIVKRLPNARRLHFQARAERWDESTPIPTLGSIDWSDTIIVAGAVRVGNPGPEAP